MENFEFLQKKHWRKNLSLSKKGKQFSIKHKKSISRAKIGTKHSTQTKLKMSLSSKGKSKSKLHAMNISIGKKGKKPKNELQWKRNLSKSHIGQPAYWKGKKLPEYVKEKIRIARMHQIFPLKDSKPEKIIQFNLSVRDINYKKHIKIIGQPDIFIEPNWCIFVDGDYWHSLPVVKKRDKLVNSKLKILNYKVIRVPEFVIKKYPNLVTECLIGIAFSD